MQLYPSSLVLALVFSITSAERLMCSGVGSKCETNQDCCSANCGVGICVSPGEVEASTEPTSESISGITCPIVQIHPKCKGVDPCRILNCPPSEKCCPSSKEHCHGQCVAKGDRNFKCPYVEDPYKGALSCIVGACYYNNCAIGHNCCPENDSGCGNHHCFDPKTGQKVN